MMKKVFLVGVLMLLAAVASLTEGANAASKRKKILLEEAKEGIHEFLESFEEAIMKSDLESFREHFAKGAVIQDSVTSKRWNAKSFSRVLAPIFAREGLQQSSENLRRDIFDITPPTFLNVHGNMAWFEHEVQFSSGEISSNHGVLINTEGDDWDDWDDWKLIEYNVTESFHAPKLSPLEVTVSALNDSLFELSVMTFNIRYGTAPDGDDSWPYRKDQLFDLIKRHDPQLLGLQEALLFQLEEITAALPNYTWIGVGRDDGEEAGEFAAILYKPKEFEVFEEGTYWFCDNPSEPGCTSYGNNLPRISTWGLFSHISSGFKLYMENVHLDHASATSRDKSAAQLVDHIYSLSGQGYPFIVTGDFNCALETSPEIIQLKEAGFDDSFRILHPNATNVGTIHYFTGTTANTKIDYVFSPRDLKVGGPTQILYAEIVHDNVGGAYPSDHFPVKATIGFPTSSMRNNLKQQSNMDILNHE